MENDEYRKTLIQFIASLTLCDHMGDVADDVEFVIKRHDLFPGLPEWYELHDLMDYFAEHGITTLYDTTFYKD